MITDKFTAVAGTVIGTEHRRTGRNNQDGYHIAANGYVISAAVSDGCSSSASSEVGAKLLSRFVAEEALKLIKYECVVKGSEIVDCLEERTIDYVRKILSMHQDPGSALDEMFLATIVGVIMNDYFTTIYTIGDGAYSLNGVVEVIDENNAPNYLAYKVLPGNYKVDESKINFQIRKEVFTDEVESVVIATDGAVELEAKAESALLVLGKQERIGGLDQFEKDSRYLKNPSLLQKRLNQLNGEKTHVNWEERTFQKVGGIFRDDTTIVMLKRKDPSTKFQR